MPANKPASPHFSADAIGETNLAKVDAHVITAEEYEEIPELTDEMMARADFRAGGPGWQTRIDAVLRDAVAREKDGPRG